MANVIPPLPTKVPLTDRNGLINLTWVSYFQEFFKRVGGSSAPSLDSLQTSVASNTAAISAAETQIATLNTEINDLNQGPYL